MSNAPHASEQSRATTKSQRVLACVLCQQRKIKCDRRFPCVTCVKAGVQCVPATQARRQRRQRFPEKELLERLRRYEDLLRQNHVHFEPLHPTVGGTAPSEKSRDSESLDDTRSHEPAPSQGDRPPSQRKIKSETVYEPKYGLSYQFSVPHS